MTTRSGLLIILSSPSGAGKSTLSRCLLSQDESIDFSISATTRKPRPGEVDGEHYHFYTKEDFETAIADGAMLEHARVFDNYYGSPKAPVEKALKCGKDVLFDVDWQGGQQIRNSVLKSHVVSVFVLPPSIAALEARLMQRGQDDTDTIERRMLQSKSEISHWDSYDYILLNDDLERVKGELLAIIQAERVRRERWPGLVSFVEGLNKEFDERQ